MRAENRSLPLWAAAVEGSQSSRDLDYPQDNRKQLGSPTNFTARVDGKGEQCPLTVCASSNAHQVD